MARAPSNFRPLGKTGLKEWSGYVREEFLHSLDGNLGMRTYREMALNHAVIGAVLYVVESLLASAPMRIVAADETPEEQEKADFISSCLADMEHTWEEFIREVVRGLVTYGWAVNEKVYKRRLGPTAVDPRFRSKFDDGRIGWRSFSPRAQDTLLNWQFDDEGKAISMVQLPPQGGATIVLPLNRCLHFRTDASKNNPEGRSLLRNAYVSWFYQKRLMEFEAIGVERDLAGIPMALVPMEVMSPEATAEQRAIYETIKEIVTRTKQDEQNGIIFPSDRDEKGNLYYEFKLLGSGGSRKIDTNPLIERYDNRIAMTLLADFVLLGHEAVGSFALSSSKTGMFARAAGALQQMIAAVINRDAIPELLRLNGFSVDKIPTGVFDDLESPDLTELGAFITQMIGSSVLTPDEGLEAFVREKAGLPGIEEDALREAGEEDTEIDPTAQEEQGTGEEEPPEAPGEDIVNGD